MISWRSKNSVIFIRQDLRRPQDWWSWDAEIAEFHGISQSLFWLGIHKPLAQTGQKWYQWNRQDTANKNSATKADYTAVKWQLWVNFAKFWGIKNLETFAIFLCFRTPLREINHKSYQDEHLVLALMQRLNICHSTLYEKRYDFLNSQNAVFSQVVARSISVIKKWGTCLMS